MRPFLLTLLRRQLPMLTLFAASVHAAQPAQNVLSAVGNISQTDASTAALTQHPLPAEHGLGEAAQQYLIEYNSTSGVDGKSARRDTAAVFIPHGETPAGGWPVVVWTHGTTGVAFNCAPSLNPRTERDSQYLNTWLSLGFAIIAPDYAGQGSAGLHHYLNARAEAWSVLDGVRAALAAFPLKNALVLVGQSQGAHAAFASAGYQPDYAPELNVRAVVLTGTPWFDANASAGQVLASAPASPGHGDPKIPYIFYLYLAAADTQPDLNPADYFQPAALPLLEQAHSQCITEMTAEVMEKQLNAANVVKPRFSRYWMRQPTRCATRHCTLPIRYLLVLAAQTLTSRR